MREIGVGWVWIQDPLPTLLFLRLPLCCFCDPLCCFCGPLCWNVFPFCWFGDPFCCFWSTKWDWAFPKCHPHSRMLILYLSRINYSGPWKAKNQQFLSNKTESTNCADQSLNLNVEYVKIDHWWHLFRCCFKLLSREEEYVQRLHLWGFSPLCVNMCRFKSRVSEAAKLHSLHLWHFSPMCVFRWLFKLLEVVDV